MPRLVATWLVTILTASELLCGQTAPLEFDRVPVAVDSGEKRNATGVRGVIYSTDVWVNGATWLRLEFADPGRDTARVPSGLGRTPPGGSPTLLRITSLLDGGQQVMTAAHLSLWGYTSAYFNGEAVRVEIVADANAPPSRLKIAHIQAGSQSPLRDIQKDIGGAASICGQVDDRAFSMERAVGRMLPPGCTAWMIDDANHCLLTAGHCGPVGGTVIEFNVPLSNPNGSLNHPPPEDQYAIDPDSVQRTNGGVGNDWSYFGCFPNSNTGLTPYEAQREFFALAEVIPGVQNQPIRITGYGVVDESADPQLNQAQKTHQGPLVAHDPGGGAGVLGYVVDTTGGNSGSPVFDLATNRAIGIHTHAGCEEGIGYNRGTVIDHAGLQLALLNPRGVCVPLPLLAFSYPDGPAGVLHPDGDSIRVEVSGANGGIPQPGTGELHFDAGGGFVTVEMMEVSPNIYDAVFPSLPCAANVEFYFSAETMKEDVVQDPIVAPDKTYRAISAVEVVSLFTDDFESDRGWTVENDANLTAGQWERGVPAGGGDRGDPPTDADGSGQCFLTQNEDGNSDVDDGYTRMTSPLLNASHPNSFLSYWRCYSNATGANPQADVFVVSISDDGGQSWMKLEVVGPTTASQNPQVQGGWFYRQFDLAAIPFFELNDQFRVRFTASDLAEGSLVEAGIDDVQVFVALCEKTCLSDVDGDKAVGVSDLQAVIAAWGACDPKAPCPADIAPPLVGDGAVNVRDLLAVLSAWGPCK